MQNTEQPLSRKHTKAVLQALFVTFLWSTSWVFIKIGLQARLPAVTFAGLRYTLAFLCLMPFVLVNPVYRDIIRGFSVGIWKQLVLLGVVFYTLTQGAQFVGLAFLPAATLTLLLNFSPIVVALLSVVLTKESPSRTQWGGIGLLAVGAMVYFLPLEGPPGQPLGWVAALVGVLANSGSAILGRRVNHQNNLPAMVITVVSMGIGGLLLLVIGVATQGWGQLDGRQWVIIGWLAVVNTAVAFTLWNRSLQTLTAVESSIINNTMLPQIALLAWLFLDEPLTPKQIIGLVLVGVGTLVVQLNNLHQTVQNLWLTRRKKVMN